MTYFLGRYWGPLLGGGSTRAGVLNKILVSYIIVVEFLTTFIYFQAILEIHCICISCDFSYCYMFILINVKCQNLFIYALFMLISFILDGLLDYLLFIVI